MSPQNDTFIAHGRAGKLSKRSILTWQDTRPKSLCQTSAKGLNAILSRIS